MPSFGGVVVATGSQATGRRTLLDVVDELARPINAGDTDIRALAADAFRSAVRWMNRKGMWPWEIQDEDIALTAGNPFTTVSGAIKKQLAMHYLNVAGGTRDQKIGYKPYDEFLEKYKLDITSEPYIYTIPNMFETGQIRWWPIPASDDNARFSYYRETPAPRNEQEAIEIPDYVSEAYMARAWYEFLKRLPSQRQVFPIAIARADAKDAFREISAHVNVPGDRTREKYRFG